MAIVLRLRTFQLALLVLFLIRASAACAADQTITLKLGVPTIYGLERPFESVLMGDPNIVDVHTINDRKVTLQPLKQGATNLIFLDSRNIAIKNLRIVVLSSDEI